MEKKRCQEPSLSFSGRYGSRVGCGGAAAPNRLFGEGCLSGASFLAILFGAEAEEPPWGRARAEMVLGPFTETKGPRLQGRNPASNNFPRNPFIKLTFVKKKAAWIPDGKCLVFEIRTYS